MKLQWLVNLVAIFICTVDSYRIFPLPILPTATKKWTVTRRIRPTPTRVVETTQVPFTQPYTIYPELNDVPSLDLLPPFEEAIIERELQSNLPTLALEDNVSSINILPFSTSKQVTTEKVTTLATTINVPVIDLLPALRHVEINNNENKTEVKSEMTIVSEELIPKLTNITARPLNNTMTANNQINIPAYIRNNISTKVFVKQNLEEKKKTASSFEEDIPQSKLQNKKSTVILDLKKQQMFIPLTGNHLSSSIGPLHLISSNSEAVNIKSNISDVILTINIPAKDLLPPSLSTTTSLNAEEDTTEKKKSHILKDETSTQTSAMSIIQNNKNKFEYSTTEKSELSSKTTSPVNLLSVENIKELTNKEQKVPNFQTEKSIIGIDLLPPFISSQKEIKIKEEQDKIFTNSPAAAVAITQKIEKKSEITSDKREVLDTTMTEKAFSVNLLSSISKTTAENRDYTKKDPELSSFPDKNTVPARDLLPPILSSHNEERLHFFAKNVAQNKLFTNPPVASTDKEEDTSKVTMSLLPLIAYKTKGEMAELLTNTELVLNDQLKNNISLTTLPPLVTTTQITVTETKKNTETQPLSNIAAVMSLLSEKPSLVTVTTHIIDLKQNVELAQNKTLELNKPAIDLLPPIWSTTQRTEEKSLRTQTTEKTMDSVELTASLPDLLPPPLGMLHTNQRIHEMTVNNEETSTNIAEKLQIPKNENNNEKFQVHNSFRVTTDSSHLFTSRPKKEDEEKNYMHNNLSSAIKVPFILLPIMKTKTEKSKLEKNMSTLNLPQPSYQISSPEELLEVLIVQKDKEHFDFTIKKKQEEIEVTTQTQTTDIPKISEGNNASRNLKVFNSFRVKADLIPSLVSESEKVGDKLKTQMKTLERPQSLNFSANVESSKDVIAATEGKKASAILSRDLLPPLKNSVTSYISQEATGTPEVSAEYFLHSPLSYPKIVMILPNIKPKSNKVQLEKRKYSGKNSVSILDSSLAEIEIETDIPENPFFTSNPTNLNMVPYLKAKMINVDETVKETIRNNGDVLRESINSEAFSDNEGTFKSTTNLQEQTPGILTNNSEAFSDNEGTFKGTTNLQEQTPGILTNNSEAFSDNEGTFKGTTNLREQTPGILTKNSVTETPEVDLLPPLLRAIPLDIVHQINELATEATENPLFSNFRTVTDVPTIDLLPPK